MKSAALSTSRDLIAIAVMLAAIRDEFGFGRERLDRIVKRANNITDSINKGLIGFDELVDTLNDKGLIGAFEKIDGKKFLDPGGRKI